MLDETSLRRPEFSDGRRVILGDGQAWTLPRPWLRLYPVRDPNGEITVGGGVGFGAAFEALMDDLTASDPDDATARLAIQFRMAALLLTRNYHLTDRDLGELLVVDASDPACRERWAEINQVLMGRPPKRSADGFATP